MITVEAHAMLCIVVFYGKRNGNRQEESLGICLRLPDSRSLLQYVLSGRGLKGTSAESNKNRAFCRDFLLNVKNRSDRLSLEDGRYIIQRVYHELHRLVEKAQMVLYFKVPSKFNPELDKKAGGLGLRMHPKEDTRTRKEKRGEFWLR